MFLFLQRTIAAAFLVSLIGLLVNGDPAYDVIWRSMIVGFGLLGLVTSAVGYFRGKPLTRIKR